MSSLVRLLNWKNIKRTLRSISKAGFFTTLRFILSDLFFDYKYKVETVNLVMLDELEIASPNRVHGHYYESTNTYLFNKVFSYIETYMPGSCFVDFGSGKGKVMLMTAERNARRVIGVEFSLDLVKICQRNLETFKRRTRSRTEFETIHMDAANYKISPDANLLFFNNPFDETVIENVAGNILRSFDRHLREIVIIHLFPQGNMAFANHPRFHIEHKLPEGFIFRLKPGN